MECIMAYLNANSNALMVIITVVYVLATIAICAANIISANATRNQIAVSHMQIAEDKKRYEESKHLQVMPFFQVSFSSKPQTGFPVILPFSSKVENKEGCGEDLYLDNIGNGPAIDLFYKWEYNDVIIHERLGAASIKSGTGCIIHVIFYDRPLNHKETCILTLCYSDFLGKKYTQDIKLNLVYLDTSPIRIELINTDLPKELK